jgi:ribonuclease BN (tRNA processing enzyme)
LLGTGTPEPSLRRASSAYLLEVGNDVILFDHGGGAYQRLLECGVPLTRVSHLFFSHLHFDHCLDYARLVLTRWDRGSGRIPELKVFGPKHTSRMSTLLFGADGVFAPDIESRVMHGGSLHAYKMRGGTPPRLPPAPEVEEISSGAIVEADGWTVRAVSVPHAQPYLESLAYRLDTPEGSVCYSGDCGPSKALVRLAQGCNVLIHMCYYISGTVSEADWVKGVAGHMEVAQVARDAKARNLVLTHIPSQMDVPGIRERIIRDIGSVYDGHVFWGEDLMEIPLNAPAPAAHVG